MNFQNKVTVITGSTAGIGEAVADQLHKHGAKVVIVSRSSEQANQKAKRLSSQGQQALGIGCDVSQPEQVKKMIDEVSQIANNTTARPTSTVITAASDPLRSVCRPPHTLPMAAMMP
ncbi:SDR family NAD(P)-dependent oxidoreductase [Cronobacter sakazakii]|nr:SDR family NAD(P)-dependent oxidoreductase [Cronobacter sakazakii]MDI7614447.1 SDR family NAD(P)-dependent oxidoreductase [Cronobacter sakazakii]